VRVNKAKIKLNKKKNSKKRKSNSIGFAHERDRVLICGCFRVIWPKLVVAAKMNLSGRTPTNPAKPPYKANQLEKIRNELSPYANSGESSSSGQQSPQPPQNQQVTWYNTPQYIIILKFSFQNFSVTTKSIKAMKFNLCVYVRHDIFFTYHMSVHEFSLFLRSK
jgi:hypothetical protein